MQILFPCDSTNPIIIAIQERDHKREYENYRGETILEREESKNSTIYNENK